MGTPPSSAAKGMSSSSIRRPFLRGLRVVFFPAAGSWSEGAVSTSGIGSRAERIFPSAEAALFIRERAASPVCRTNAKGRLRPS